MIEGGDGHRIHHRVNAERGQRGADSSAIEVAHRHLDQPLALPLANLYRLGVIHDDQPLAFDHAQIVVESAGGVWGGVAGEARLGMVARRPATGTTAHRASGQQHGPPLGGRPVDALGDDDRGRGHHHLKTVLDGAVALEEQDILRSGADIDRQHTPTLARSRARHTRHSGHGWWPTASLSVMTTTG